MTTLVVGATGATGRLLVDRLLSRGEPVRALVRGTHTSAGERADLPPELRPREGLELVRGTVLDMDEAERLDLVRDCDAICSCLGHNLSFRGMWLPPWRLVTKTLRALCAAATELDGDRHVRVVLMSSSGVRDRELHEPVSPAQHAVLWLLRLFVPPHPDNERAADHLRLLVGRDHPRLEWCAVRPDGLVDAEELAPYELHPSPIRSAIFDAGRVARVQVADLMARLVTEDELWDAWQARMPVVYDAAEG